MSDASRHAMYITRETEYGTTPATPVMDTLRNTGTTLALTKDTFQSEELRADRQLKCFEHGVKQVGGDVSIELSPTTYSDILEAVFLGTWTADTPIAGTDQLKAGVVRRSFTVVRHFTDQEVADEPYYTFTGCEFNTLDLTIDANAVVTGSLGILGKGLAIDGTGPTGHTVQDPTGSCPYDSFTGTISEGGTPTAIVTALSITLENGLDPKFVIGSDTTTEPAIGLSNLTGQVTAYFEDSTMYKKFVDETNSSLEFSLVAAEETLTFKIPNIKYTGSNNDVSGQGPISVVLPFQAILDDTEATQVLLERIVTP